MTVVLGDPPSEDRRGPGRVIDVAVVAERQHVELDVLDRDRRPQCLSYQVAQLDQVGSSPGRSTRGHDEGISRSVAALSTGASVAVEPRRGLTVTG